MDLSRSEILIGEEKLNRLREATVVIIGLGGVGGHAAESIVRAGVGNIIIADYDRIAPSNMNRQILSLESTMGSLKTDAAKGRFLDINPHLNIRTISERITPINITSLIDFKLPMYAIDAIDEIDAKTTLIAELVNNRIPFVSSMGAGSRLDSLKIRVDDISRTHTCPLARIVRKRLKLIGIEKGVRCIYSTEELNKVKEPEQQSGKRMQGSSSFIPGIFGLIAAGLIINDIIK